MRNLRTFHTKKTGTARALALALALSLTLLAGCGGPRSVNASWPDMGAATPGASSQAVPASEAPPSSQPGDNSVVPVADDTKAYRLFEISDPVFSGMAAFRTWLPEGWTAEGGVDWACNSSAAPAQIWLKAVSGDGAATLHITTEEWYADGTAAVWGYPQRAAYAAGDAALAQLAAIGAENITFTAHLEQAAVDDYRWGLFESAIGQKAEELAAQGRELADPFFEDGIFEGAVEVDGVPHDVRVFTTVWGYTATGGGVADADYRVTDGAVLMLAPQGTMAEYLSDMLDIQHSAAQNNHWLRGEIAVRDALLLLSSGWEQAQLQCPQLCAQVDAGMEHGSQWANWGRFGSRAIIDNRSELWPAAATEQVNFQLGENEGVVSVPSTWGTAWLGPDGSVLVCKEAGPPGGPGTEDSYTALERV